MRSKHTLALLLILLVVSVPVGMYVRQHNKLESAWESVNQAAVRLESSIQYEPAIVVRTKMAELDAALNNYKTVKEGLLVGRFEKGNDGKFQDLEQTLYHLSIGLEESSHDRMQIVEEDWPPFKVDTFPADDLHRYCSEGKLYILISELGHANTLAALRTLSKLRGVESVAATKFDREKAATACTVEEQARQVSLKNSAEQAKASAEQTKASAEQARLRVEKEAELREAEDRHARSIAKCDHFEKYVKPGSSVLSADDIARFKQKCADLQSGKINDL